VVRGRDEVLILLDLGSSAGSVGRPCLDEAFLLGLGLKAGVLSDVGGLVSVEACSLLGIGEACFEVVVSDLFLGEGVLILLFLVPSLVRVSSVGM